MSKSREDALLPNEVTLGVGAGEVYAIIPEAASAASIDELFEMMKLSGYQAMDESEDLPEEITLHDGTLATKVWFTK